MHSPERMHALAHLRAASLPPSGRTWPVRTMSMPPPMTAVGFFSSSALSPPGAVTGKTSTHLPQRVQASAIACARASNAASKVCAVSDFDEELCVTPLAYLLFSVHSRASGNPDQPA